VLAGFVISIPLIIFTIPKEKIIYVIEDFDLPRFPKEIRQSPS